MSELLNRFSAGITDGGVTPGVFSVCVASALVLGALGALVYMGTGKHAKSFTVTIAILPAVVTVVIMLVNGNIGAGIAVAGAFSLVRFRSIPGSARDMAAVFIAMALGFVCGMGYPFYGALFLLFTGAAALVYRYTPFGGRIYDDRVLKILLPENYDYDELFDDILKEYTRHYELERVKTANMGSLYELKYVIRMKTPDVPKAFIDALRVRNGNLSITVSREKDKYEL